MPDSSKAAREKREQLKLEKRLRREVGKAIADFNIDVGAAALVGDSVRDLEAGSACNLGYLIGYGDHDFGGLRPDLQTSKWADISRILTSKEW